MSIEHAITEARSYIAQISDPAEDRNHILLLEKLWKPHPEVIVHTMPDLVRQTPDQDDILFYFLWGVIVQHIEAGQDLGQVPFDFVDWTAQSNSTKTLRGMILGETRSWMKRDGHMRTALPLILDWCKKHQTYSQTQALMTSMPHEIIALVCRDQNHAYELLERAVRPYFTPDQIITVNTGNHQGPWVQAWANHSFNAMESQPCGDRALDWLVRWGVEIDAPVETMDGSCVPITMLAKSISKLSEGIPASTHPVALLIEHGAQWKNLFEQASAAQQQIMKTLPPVRKHLLVEQVSQQHQPTTPKPKF